MEVRSTLPQLDALLEARQSDLGADFDAYRNHCCRVGNFCLALVDDALSGAAREEAAEKVGIALAFHDLGIWTDHTFDYLAPSRRLARDWLAANGRAAWTEEIEAMIEFHHKITAYTGSGAILVEAFRRADLVDVSLGLLRAGLPRDFVAAVRASFPNRGFHRRLVELTGQRLLRHPLSPMPMMRW